MPKSEDHMPPAQPVTLWYVTDDAILDYMDIADLDGPLDDANPNYRAAKQELRSLSFEARLADTKPGRSGSLTYRCKATIGEHRRRLEFTVSPHPRPEGPLPQLLRVRLKG